MCRPLVGAALAGLLALSSSAVAATTYYVAPSGSDANACAQTTPCRQIRRALTLVVAGDTILVADGSYLGFDVRDLVGTAGSPITIRAQGAGAQVTPTTDRSDNRDTIFITYSSYIVIDGLRSFSATRAAVRVDSSPNVTIRNGVFGNNTVWGIFTDFSDDLLIEKNECYGSVQQHGIYVSNSGDRPVVRGNRVHDNHDSGIQLNADLSQGGDGLITGALIEDNVIYNNGAGGGGSINLDGVQDSIVRNNLLYNNLNTGIVNYQGDGAAGPKGMQVLNNTVVQAATGRWAMLIWSSAGPNVVRNNILYHPSASRGSIDYLSATDVLDTDSDYNVITNVTPNDGTVYTLAQWQAQGHEPHSITATPSALFVDPASANYHLSATSPAIDRGQALANVPDDIEGRLRPVGVTWDLGAYEGATAPPPPGSEPVVWTSLVGVSANGNSLTKTTASAWGNAGATSSQQITSGSGYVEITASETTTYRMIGLSNGNTNTSYEDIDFALYLALGQLRVYESGTSKGTFGNFATGDKLRVAVANGQVTYSRNGSVFYTSTKTAAYPLLVDCALYTQGATLLGAVIGGAGPPPPPPPPSSAPVAWTALVGVTASGSSLTKTATSAWGNGGAISSQQITSGDGYVETTASETTTYRMIGLSNGNTNASYEDIDFALYLALGQLRVYESGTSKGTFGNFATGDKLRVALVGGTVAYSRNGTIFYTSTKAPSYPLLVDAALYTQGATLSSAVIAGGSAAPPPPSSAPVAWASLVGVTASGNSLTKTASSAWGNGGAVSSQQIASGSGYVEITASETTTYRMIGLSNGDTNASYEDVDFALYLALGQLRVYESGTSKGTFGNFAAGDKLRVAVANGQVTYSRNGSVFYTSSKVAVYPLLVDCALYTQGATLASAVIGGAP
jgi:hypothetical protein